MKLKLFLGITLLCGLFLTFTGWLAFAAKPDKPMLVKVKAAHGEDASTVAAKWFKADMDSPAAKVWLPSIVRQFNHGKSVWEEGEDVRIPLELPLHDVAVKPEYLNPQGKIKEWGKLAKELGMDVQELKRRNGGK